MEQLWLDQNSRRIDTTLSRLQQSLDAMSEGDRVALAAIPQFSVIVMVSRLRAMELAEKEALPSTIESMADAYDRVAVIGENAADAIIRTFKEVYTNT